MIGVVVAWILSMPARRLAQLGAEEKTRQKQDRSIGQILLQISSVHRQYASHPNLFPEDEMRDWLTGDEPLRLHAALRLLKSDGNAKPANGDPGYWIFD